MPLQSGGGDNKQKKNPAIPPATHKRTPVKHTHTQKRNREPEKRKKLLPALLEGAKPTNNSVQL